MDGYKMDVKYVGKRALVDIIIDMMPAEPRGWNRIDPYIYGAICALIGGMTFVALS